VVSTFLCQRCDGGVEKKNKKELGLWCLEVNFFGHLVVYMEGNESSDV